MIPTPTNSTLFPYTTLFRSHPRVLPVDDPEPVAVVEEVRGEEVVVTGDRLVLWADQRRLDPARVGQRLLVDRKSTRLNSSHGYISYAVFCLKKKTQHDQRVE